MTKTPKRSCNRHADCDAAEAEFRRLYPKGKHLDWNGVTVYVPDHCHDDECEDCFGS